MGKAEIIHAFHNRLHSIISTLDHSSAATSERILKADANGLPVEATNTDAEVAAAVAAGHARQHNIIDPLDHTSGATPGRILQANANGLPINATNTDAQVAGAVALAHIQGTDTALGAVGVKSPPIDADKPLYRDSTAGDALVTSTWTQIKAFLKTYFDTLYRLATADHTHQSSGAQAGKLDHGLALDGLSDDDHPQYIKHSLATAISNFLVASGAGVFVKKTLAEVKTILGLGTAAYTAATDYVTHALATAANDFLVASGAGVFVKKTLAEVKTLLGFTTVTLEYYGTNIWSDSAMGSTPFTAKINGIPTATSVVYDTDTGDTSLNTGTGLGKLILYNLTRSNSRLITSVNRTTNTITTPSSTDDWADNDNITTLSQTVGSNFVDLDLSGFISAAVTGLILEIYIYDTTVAGQLIRAHPYGVAFATARSFPLWNKVVGIFDTLDIIVPVVSQRISFLVTASGATTAYVVLRYKGKLE